MKSRLDDELAIFDHDILFRARSLFEFTIAESTCQQARRKALSSCGCNIPKASEVHFLSPDIRVETLTPILVKHQFVSVVDDGAEAVVDEIPGNSKAQRQSD